MLLGISYDPSLANKWGALQGVDIGGHFLGYSNKGFIDNFNLTTKYWFIRSERITYSF